ncbi:hypothetical protein EVAR_99283_1 [Eumeta japonica]|uniref:Uncharacterized protein n=1 Tax=Eumeta variegata TaxID=151549 RepID=A0A4C1ZB75_EUMVA|nr:hypothetical protein EVAR_99283_1 [Eumeta japonica]
MIFGEIVRRRSAMSGARAPRAARDGAVCSPVTVVAMHPTGLTVESAVLLTKNISQSEKLAHVQNVYRVAELPGAGAARVGAGCT